MDLPIGSIIIFPQILGDTFMLNATIDDVQTFITIMDDPPDYPAPPIPVPPFIITIGSGSFLEHMLVTAMPDPLTWTVTRGYDGTTPQYHYKWAELQPDYTLDNIPIGWAVRHEFDDCLIPCAGGVYAVNSIGGSNHLAAVSHVHDVGTLECIANANTDLHIHNVIYTFNTASSGSVIDTVGTGATAYSPNHDHTHTLTRPSFGAMHGHDMSGEVNTSIPSGTPWTGTACIGVYFIQKVA